MTLGTHEPMTTSTPTTGRSTARGLPFGAVMGLLTGILVYATSATTLRDIDLYWHLLAGKELVDGTPPSRLGLDWSFAPDPQPWTSTQWLAEVAFHAIQQPFGWAGLAGFRVVTAAVALGILAWTTLRRRPKALAAFPFLVAATAIAFASQERPQQFTLIGAAALGGVLVAGLVERSLPRWSVLLPATAVWANLHGGWVLVPAVLGLLALGGWLDRGLRDRTAWRAVGLAGMAALAGCLTPSGVAGLTAVVRFNEAAELIAEWRPTEPASDVGLLTVLMAVILVTGWSRPARVPLSEMVAGMALLVFSWLAWRNIAPGMAILAPVAAQRLMLAFPRAWRPEPSWSTPVGVVIASIMTMAALATLPAREHLPVTTEPISLASSISELPAGQRVLNDYNTAGVVLYFGGQGTTVAIDGRSDRYGSTYITDYVKLMSLEGDWKKLLQTLQPTSALVRKDEALAYYLAEVEGWTTRGEENGYVLLVSPGDRS